MPTTLENVRGEPAHKGKQGSRSIVYARGSYILNVGTCSMPVAASADAVPLESCGITFGAVVGWGEILCGVGGRD